MIFLGCRTTDEYRREGGRGPIIAELFVATGHLLFCHSQSSFHTCTNSSLSSYTPDSGEMNTHHSTNPFNQPSIRLASQHLGQFKGIGGRAMHNQEALSQYLMPQLCPSIYIYIFIYDSGLTQQFPRLLIITGLRTESRIHSLD